MKKILISLTSLLVFTSCILHVYRFTSVNYNNSRISISTGLVDATETLVTKLGGLLGNQNWGAKKLEKMFKDNPWIMEKMNWHSQEYMEQQQ